MELQIQNKVTGIYTETDHQIKTIQEVCESVVPDKNDDIAKIASVQTNVLLKNKELSGRGVRVTGEAIAELVYITETEDKISSLEIRKAFEIDFHAEEAGAESLIQLKLCVNNAEARIINPRKLSLCFEISAELSCFKPDTIKSEAALSENKPTGIHLKRENAETWLLKRVCEKSFAVNEQFTFPAAEPVPAELLYMIPEFKINEIQQIGSKIILKAEVNIECCYISEGEALPVRKIFTAAISQIVDAEEEELESFYANIQLTGAYFDLIDTINGDKAVEAELHALIQLQGSRREKISYISDAYSNMMPCVCKMNSEHIKESSECECLEFQREEHINIPEPFGDVIMLMANLSQTSAAKGKLRALLSLDIVYRTEEGKLSSARRILNIEEDIKQEQIRILNKAVKEISFTKEEDGINVKIDFRFETWPILEREIVRVEGLELMEDKRYDLSELPGLSMVRRDGESLWKLAKIYHSSVESIEFMNPQEEETDKALLLILKECR